MTYVSQGWKEETPFDIAEMDEENLVDVKGDGEYEVSYQTQSEEDFDDVNMLLLATDLKNGAFADSFNITATKLKVNDTEYKLNTDEGNLMFKDDDVEKGCLIYNVRNPYNYKIRRSMIKEDWSDDDVYIYDENGDKIVCDNILDKNGEIAKVPVPAGAKMTICFTVTDMGFVATETPTKEPTMAPTEAPTKTPAAITETESPIQTPTQDPTPTVDPSQGDTGNTGNTGNTGTTATE